MGSPLTRILKRGSRRISAIGSLPAVQSIISSATSLLKLLHCFFSTRSSHTGGRHEPRGARPLVLLVESFHEFRSQAYTVNDYIVRLYRRKQHVIILRCTMESVGLPAGSTWQSWGLPCGIRHTGLFYWSEVFLCEQYRATGQSIFVFSICQMFRRNAELARSGSLEFDEIRNDVLLYTN